MSNNKMTILKFYEEELLNNAREIAKSKAITKVALIISAFDLQIHFNKKYLATKQTTEDEYYVARLLFINEEKKNSTNDGIIEKKFIYESGEENLNPNFKFTSEAYKLFEEASQMGDDSINKFPFPLFDKILYVLVKNKDTDYIRFKEILNLV